MEILSTVSEGLDRILRVRPEGLMVQTVSGLWFKRFRV